MFIISNTESRQTFGRSKLYTSLDPVEKNIPAIINSVLPTVMINSENCQYLWDYYKGDQPILYREKVVRKDISNNTVVNMALVITRMSIGYFLGTPIKYSPSKKEFTDEIDELNTACKYESKRTVDMEIAEFCSVMGIGYRATLSGDNDNGTKLSMSSLDPRSTFQVLSTKIGNKPVLTCSVTTNLDEKGNPESFNYLVYTKDKYYEYLSDSSGMIKDPVIRSSNHGHNGNPIQAYYNNPALLGDFEIVLTLLDANNVTVSNSIDDIEQTVQSLLLLFGIDEEQHENVMKVESGDILIFSGKEGINQDGKYLNSSLDSQSVEFLRAYLDEVIKVIAGIPDRKTRGGGGGDTGDAVKLRDGWGDLEVVARNKEAYWEKGERESINIILGIIDGVNGLSTKDIDIKFSRNKMDNISSKTQAGQSLYNMNVDKEDIATIMDLSTNNTEMVARWEENDKKVKEDNNKNVVNPLTD